MMAAETDCQWLLASRPEEAHARDFELVETEFSESDFESNTIPSGLLRKNLYLSV